jgi:hypothetical protein
MNECAAVVMERETTEHSNINILCFTEHWLSEFQLKVSNIGGFRLVSNFSRSRSASGGSYRAFVRETPLKRKKLKEKAFEISAIELSIPYWPAFIDCLTVISIHFYILWSCA